MVHKDAHKCNVKYTGSITCILSSGFSVFLFAYSCYSSNVSFCFRISDGNRWTLVFFCLDPVL